MQYECCILHATSLSVIVFNSSLIRFSGSVSISAATVTSRQSTSIRKGSSAGFSIGKGTFIEGILLFFNSRERPLVNVCHTKSSSAKCFEQRCSVFTLSDSYRSHTFFHNEQRFPSLGNLKFNSLF